MEVESTLSRNRDQYDRRVSASWVLAENSNCRLVLCILVGLAAGAFLLLVQAISGPIDTTFLAGFWRVVSPWLVGISSVILLICAAAVAWQIHMLKLARDEQQEKIKLAQRSTSLARQTELLIKEARANNDNVKIAYDTDQKVKSVEVIRTAVLLEQTRIQELARLQKATRTVTEHQSSPAALPGRGAAQQIAGPATPKLIVPPAYDLLPVLRNFPLAEDNIFLGIDSEKQYLTCDPRVELCHGAFNAVSGRGKTILVRGLETQILKVGHEVIHADIKFSLVDEKGNDYRPIARHLINQGDIPGLALPHLLLREDHIVQLIEWLATTELTRRLAMYARGDHSYSVLFVFLEELAYLVGIYKHLGPMIARLLNVGRSLGIKVFAVAQNFQVQNLKLNSGMRENFESAWFLGGDIHSGAALLDMTRAQLETLLAENDIRLGKGVSLFRNNAVAYDARVLRTGMASNDFVYHFLGQADGFTLPDYILPSLDTPTTPNRGRDMQQRPTNVVEADFQGRHQLGQGQPKQAVNEPVEAVEGHTDTSEFIPLKDDKFLPADQWEDLFYFYGKLGNVRAALLKMGITNSRYVRHASFLLEQRGMKQKRA